MYFLIVAHHWLSGLCDMHRSAQSMREEQFLNSKLEVPCNKRYFFHFAVNFQPKRI